MTVRAATPEEFRWLTQRTGYEPGAGFRAIVQEVGGRLLGLVGFDGWTPGAVWMHVATEAPGACRGLLRAAFHYAFDDTSRRVALGLVRASNVRSLRLAERLGFREVGRLRDAWDEGEDVVLLEMRREECRWIGGGMSYSVCPFACGDHVRQVRQDEPDSDLPSDEVCVVTSDWASAVTMRVLRPSGEETLVDCKYFELVTIGGHHG